MAKKAISKPKPNGYKKDGRIDLRRLPQIIERPLLRHIAEGLAFQKLHGDASGDRVPVKEPKIEIDSRLRGRVRLETIIHEALHLACPWMPEITVGPVARYVSMVVWKMGYRIDEFTKEDVEENG